MCEVCIPVGHELKMKTTGGLGFLLLNQNMMAEA